MMDDKRLDRMFGISFVVVGVAALATVAVVAWGFVTIVNWLVTK